MSTEASESLGSWLTSLLSSIFFLHNSFLTVRIISGIFAALGVAFVFPIVSLIVFDICLWAWRLYASSRHAYQRQQQQEQQRQRQLREEFREQRKQQQMQRTTTPDGPTVAFAKR